jgi:hypothetical protein
MVMLTVFFVDLCGAWAFAQEPAKLPKDDKGILQWVIALGLAIVVLVSAFMNPKRSHLD